MNTFLTVLGFAPTDRVVIVHADDVGMCQASVSAFAHLIEVAPKISATTMANCPWFSAAAALCRATPSVDMGIHFTLTSEWDSFRWGPLTDNASSLLDDEGYFPRSVAQLWSKCEPDAVQREIEAQIERVLAAKVDITHVDDHMLGLQSPIYLTMLAKLAERYALPPRQMMIPAPTTAFEVELNAIQAAMGQQGFPIFDRIVDLSLDEPSGKLEFLQQEIPKLAAGTLTLIVGHPASDTPELRALAPDWRCRVTDLETFSNPALYKSIQDAGIHQITFRDVRDAMRKTMIPAR